ncbi:hypothetical protein BGZ76_008964 [Entomortierella beljakovae]|nr:hypothetical protein BGZ76_008964 [Entomortierella beljakovae]
MIQIAILSSQVDTAMSQMSANQRMKITSSMQAKRLLRGQWRPALMLATVMASITVFWLFYYVDAHHMHGLSITTDWVQIWLGCIGAHFASGVSSDETQTICSNLIKDHLPSIPWFAASESLVAIIGIIITPVFVGKKEFWSEWATLISSFIGRHGPGTDSERQGSADEGKPSGIDYNENHVHYDHHNLRKGYNDELPPHLIADNKIFHANNELEDPQLYDMDELLDREYDLQETKLQRGTSVGSRNDMFSVPNQDPPRYLSSPIPDPYDMSYSSPAKEVEPWSSSSQTLTSPSKAYLVANDISDRYVEKPVVPRPVPRASLRSKNIQQESNDEQVSSSPSSLQSPVYAPTPLSPMPPKPQSMSRSNSTLRKKEPDSVPIVKKVNGSPSASYNSPSPLRSALLSSNDSREQIMVASRESVTELGHGSIIGRGLSKILPHRQSTDTPKPYNPRNEDIRIQSSTPPVPLKSPARRQDSIRRGQHNQPSNGQNEIQRSNSVPHDINGIFLTQ